MPLTLSLPILLLASAFGQATGEYHQWHAYAGDLSGSHYSSLDQINIANVHELEIAWEFHAGDATAFALPDPE